LPSCSDIALLFYCIITTATIIPAGPASGVSFPRAPKHILTARFRFCIFTHSGLHIPGRSLTRSTVPVSSKALEHVARRHRIHPNHPLYFWYKILFTNCTIVQELHPDNNYLFPGYFPYSYQNRTDKVSDILNLQQNSGNHKSNKSKYKLHTNHKNLHYLSGKRISFCCRKRDNSN